VILTISLGFLFRAGRSFVWGHETQTFETPFTNRIINAAGAILALESLSMIAGTVVLAGLLYHFFDFTPSSPAPRSATVPTNTRVRRQRSWPRRRVAAGR